MFQKKIKDKLSQYTDPTGEFSNRELKLAEWYVKNKLKLKKNGIGLLVVWCVLTIGYSFGYWGYYFSTGYFRDQEMMTRQTLEFENYGNLKRFYAPRDFNIGSHEVYQSVSPQNYDFVADIANPNERWLAMVEYKFVFNGGETSLAQTIVLPGSQRPLAFLGFKSTDYPSNVKLAIKEIHWRHLNRHLYPNVKNFMAERNMWGMNNFKFTSMSRLTGASSHRIEFDLINYSAYNFWQVNFFVELLNDERRVGIIYLPEERFRAGETRHVDLRSLAPDLYVNDARLHPLVNFFDPGEYFSAGEGKP